MNRAKKIFCIILAAVSFLYYLWLGTGSSFHLSLLIFWPLLSFFFLLVGFWQNIPFTEKIPAVVLKISKFVLTALCTLFLILEGMVLWGMTLSEPSQEELDYLIVLGAGVDGEQPSYTLELRLKRALPYLESHPETRVIVSGGLCPGEIISEAESMLRWLTSRGIEPSRILMEDSSSTTAENMQYSFPILISDLASREISGKAVPEISVGIVTSNFHIFRSLSLADHAAHRNGILPETCHLYGMSADFPATSLPHYMMREFFTICADTALRNMDFF